MARDPKTYREMSVPYPSVDVAQVELTAFFEGLGELRKKHKVANVYAIMCINVVTEDGEEAQIMTSTGYGDATLDEAMTAWAFGKEQAEREERIGKLLAQKVTKRELKKQGKS